MPPLLLFDLSKIELDTKPVFTREDIEKMNPQRYEMEHLDGVLWYDKEKRLILIAGRYEGFDERIRTGLGAEQISVGDFVLSGGELAAMTVIDAVVRL